MTTPKAETSINAGPGEQYWRSVNEYSQSPELAEKLSREFPEYDPDALLTGTRRSFLKVAAASMAFAGLALQGCRRWPKEEVLPYNARPDGSMPGVPETFASMVQRGGFARSLFVTSFDGRPIGVDGNPMDAQVGDPDTFRRLLEEADAPGAHQQHRNRANSFVGVADLYAQAMCLEMYDPDRARSVLRVTRNTDLDAAGAAVVTERAAFDDFIADAPFAGRVAVLAEPGSGPAYEAARDRFVQRHGAGSWVTYEPFHQDNVRLGAEMAFGRPVRAVYDAEQADVMALFDSSFLHDHPQYISNSRGWARNRRSMDGLDADGNPTGRAMSRVYAAGPVMSPTLVSSDVHIQVRPSAVPTLITALASRLGVPGVADPGPLNGKTDFIERLARDLRAAPAGRSLVEVGAGQPAAVHALVHAINDHLGNLGTTVTLVDDPVAREETGIAGLRGLTARMAAGEVDTLLVLGGNPVFNAPADVPFAAALANVNKVAHLGLYFNETSAASNWLLPMAHTFEAWGDGRGWDGTLMVQQPLIEPLYGGRSAIELAAMAAGHPVTQGYHLVREAWTAVVGGGAYDPATATWGGAVEGLGAEKTWRRFVHDGLVPDSAFTPVGVGATAPDAAALAAASAKPAADAVELCFQAGPAYDGRYANSGWLQELPDNLTKTTWETPALVSVADATRLGLRNGDYVHITLPDAEGVDRKLTAKLPVYVTPGQPVGCIGIKLGGGRRVGGRIATGTAHDAFPLYTTAGSGARGVVVAKAGGSTPLAVTSEHHLIDPGQIENDGRSAVLNSAVQKRTGKLKKKGADGVYKKQDNTSGYLVKQTTYDDFLKNPTFATDGAHGDVRLQLFNPPSVNTSFNDVEDRPDYIRPNPEGPSAFNIPHAWGMTIDLSTCTGCNNCVIACQSENNIPVVGKDQVLMSREMHWIRIDSYFKGDPTATSSDKLQTVNMPVACVQCENAPCEQVCPVAATVHDTEGLNTMVYNRCIGTRYCSNNCPYKVRRFNYFDYHSKLETVMFRTEGGGGGVLNLPWLDWPDQQQLDTIDPVRRMLFNPDVTVRMRGVMEKCTYCSQRITRTKITAKADWARRKTAGLPTDDYPYLLDGEVRTACQTACPTGAITFGNLNDPASEVSIQQQKNTRSYRLLEELNARPRTQHMALVRNPGKGSKPA